MKVCTECKQVKFDFSFYKLHIYVNFEGMTHLTDLCKKCAKNIAEAAIIKYIEKGKK